MKVHPHRATTDPCEHHFGNGRQNQGGSRQGMTMSAWWQTDNKSAHAKPTNYAAVGNNRNAEQIYDSEDIY